MHRPPEGQGLSYVAKAQSWSAGVPLGGNHSPGAHRPYREGTSAIKGAGARAQSARVVSRVLLGGQSQKSLQSSIPEEGNQAISRDQNIRVSLFFCPF